MVPPQRDDGKSNRPDDRTDLDPEAIERETHEFVREIGHCVDAWAKKHAENPNYQLPLVAGLADLFAMEALGANPSLERTKFLMIANASFDTAVQLEAIKRLREEQS